MTLLSFAVLDNQMSGFEYSNKPQQKRHEVPKKEKKRQTPEVAKRSSTTISRIILVLKKKVQNTVNSAMIQKTTQPPSLSISRI